MSLLSVQPEVVEALRRLEVPHEDVTPPGYADGARHVIAVGLAQRDVLLSWGVPFDELESDNDVGAAAADRDRDRAARGGDSRRTPRPDAQLALEQAIIQEALAARGE